MMREGDLTLLVLLSQSGLMSCHHILLVLHTSLVSMIVINQER